MAIIMKKTLILNNTNSKKLSKNRLAAPAARCSFKKIWKKSARGIKLWPVCPGVSSWVPDLQPTISKQTQTPNLEWGRPNVRIRGDRARNPLVFGADFLKSSDLAQNWVRPPPAAGKKLDFWGPKIAISKGKSVILVIFGRAAGAKNTVFWHPKSRFLRVKRSKMTDFWGPREGGLGYPPLVFGGFWHQGGVSWT